MEVHLLPPSGYGARLRQVWEHVLAERNGAQPVWPDGSGRALQFRLADRSRLEVRLAAD